MPWRQQWVMGAVALAFLLTMLELVRRRLLRAGWAALWLSAAAGVMLLVLRFDLLLWLSRQLGVVHPPSALFLLGILFLLSLSVYFSIRLTRLSRQLKAMVQENALLRQELETRDTERR